MRLIIKHLVWDEQLLMKYICRRIVCILDNMFNLTHHKSFGSGRTAINKVNIHRHLAYISQYVYFFYQCFYNILCVMLILLILVYLLFLVYFRILICFHILWVYYHILVFFISCFFYILFFISWLSTGITSGFNARSSIFGFVSISRFFSISWFIFSPDLFNYPVI